MGDDEQDAGGATWSRTDVVTDSRRLLALVGLDEESAVDDWLLAEADYDGDAYVGDEGVELVVCGVGVTLAYPFTLDELLNLAQEHELEFEDRQIEEIDAVP